MDHDVYTVEFKQSALGDIMRVTRRMRGKKEPRVTSL